MHNGSSQRPVGESLVQFNHSQIRAAGRSLCTEYVVLETFFSSPAGIASNREEDSEDDADDVPTRYMLRALALPPTIDRRRPSRRRRRPAEPESEGDMPLDFSVDSPRRAATGNSSNDMEEDESADEFDRCDDDNAPSQRIVYQFPQHSFFGSCSSPVRPSLSPPSRNDAHVDDEDDDDETRCERSLSRLMNRFDAYFARHS
jgi:hypothetical protein